MQLSSPFGSAQHCDDEGSIELSLQLGVLFSSKFAEVTLSRSSNLLWSRLKLGIGLELRLVEIPSGLVS